MATLVGDNSSNNMFGNNGEDEIYALLGDDIVHGLEGADKIYGDSSSAEVQSVNPEIDGSYNIQNGTFLSVTLSQFNFTFPQERSLGYALLDLGGNVLSKNIIVDYVSLAERSAGIDINVVGAVKLVFFTIEATALNSFPWTPFVLSNVDTNVSLSEVNIQVQEIDSDPSSHGNDSLYGDLGDDSIFGEGGNDNIGGAAGHDVLSGGEGNDSLWGGNGDDILHGGHGNDQLFGEIGHDKLEGGEGDDDLWGGLGNDILFADEGSDHVEGGAGDDLIHGGDGNDEIWAGAGADKVHGDNGNDYIHAGKGEDLVFGGSGDDIIYGGADADNLRGGAGDDKLYGQKGNDILYGKSGNDFLDGGDGNDTLYGTIGSNTLLGGKGDDTLFAGWTSHDNFLDGQGGEDFLFGSSNSDTFIFDAEDFQGKITTLSGGKQINQHIYDASSGFDTLRISGQQHVDFTGELYQTNASVKGNVISGIESVIGDSNDQIITINLHEIEAQSDDVSGAKWDGFIAWLGNGDDTLHLTGLDWAYEETSAPNASISTAMITKMNLTPTQITELNSYVFKNTATLEDITIWTDADNISYFGSDIF